MAIVIATVAASPARAPDTIRCNTFSRDHFAKRRPGAIVPEGLFARLSWPIGVAERDIGHLALNCRSLRLRLKLRG